MQIGPYRKARKGQEATSFIGEVQAVVPGEQKDDVARSCERLHGVFNVRSANDCQALCIQGISKLPGLVLVWRKRQAPLSILHRLHAHAEGFGIIEGDKRR